MRLSTLISLGVLGLALASCNAPPESAVALSEPGDIAYDERLIGVWYRVDAKGYVFGSADAADWSAACALSLLTVWPSADRKILNVTLTISSFGNELCLADSQELLPAYPWLEATFHATAFPSILDGRTYFNVKRVAGMGDDYSPAGEQPGFIIVQAKIIEGDKLALYFLNPGGYLDGDGSSYFEQHGIKTKRSKPLGSDPDFWRDYHLFIEATREELQAFVRKNASDRELLWRGANWSRLPLPDSE